MDLKCWWKIWEWGLGSSGLAGPGTVQVAAKSCQGGDDDDGDSDGDGNGDGEGGGDVISWLEWKLSCHQNCHHDYGHKTKIKTVPVIDHWINDWWKYQLWYWDISFTLLGCFLLLLWEKKKPPGINWTIGGRLLIIGCVLGNWYIQVGVDESLTTHNRITKIFHPDSARVVLRCRSILINVGPTC